ncbi:MAG: response regulator transcription factor [Lysobacteraceae bacterium]
MHTEDSIRVLVVEDDVEFREGVVLPELRSAGGFRASGVGSAAELYRHLLVEPADIVVLDLGLPDENGLDVARYLRERTQVGVVMLTGRVEVSEQVTGLKSGADAYLAKPVSMELLIATLRTVQRRLSSRDAAATEKNWRSQADGWRLIAPNERRVELVESERVVMTLLLDNAGSPVDRAELLARLSGNQPDFDPHRLEMIVYRLRRKVEDETGMLLPLRALRGRGYLFTQPV